MKSFAWSLVGLVLLSVHVGCCSVRFTEGCCPDMMGSPCGVGCQEPVLQGPLANRFRMNHCNSGCGEVYWDEQINEPPVCDPCGCNNEFIGGAGCGRCPGALHRLRQLWGFHYVPSDCGTCSTGCESCGGASSGSLSGGSTCSSCSSGSVSYGSDAVHHHQGSTPSASKPSMKTQPTPAKPKEVVPEVLKQAPAGDTTRSVSPSPNRVVGSGTVKAKPASGRPRLVAK